MSVHTNNVQQLATASIQVDQKFLSTFT